MMMTRWVPRETASYEGRLDRELRLMNRLFDDVIRTFDRDVQWAEPDWAFPRVDIIEKEEEYVMRADLPGLRREDVQIDVAPDHVVVKGTYADDESLEGCVVCSERSAGTFERTIPFPGEVRMEDVTATMKEGLLTVHLPKAQSSSLRRIELTEH